MKINFQLQGINLANNGGSATIIASANTLSSMGEEVFLIMNEPSQFSWFPLLGPKEIITSGKDYPDADVHIATGAKSVIPVLDAPIESGKKFWWIRAHEKWVMPEENLYQLYRNIDISLLVNSIHLQKFLKGYIERDSVIMYPGQDLDKFYPTIKRTWEKKEWVLGGLYNTKQRKRFQWIQEIYTQLRNRKIPVKLKLFGTEKLDKKDHCDEYLYQPTKDELREFYNGIDFWIAPTLSEGLHIPPQEAALCGSIVIGALGELTGMDDYLIHNVTGMKFLYYTDAINLILGLIKDKEKMKLLSVNGRNKIISLGNRVDNMQRMINYFKVERNGMVRKVSVL